MGFSLGWTAGHRRRLLPPKRSRPGVGWGLEGTVVWVCVGGGGGHPGEGGKGEEREGKEKGGGVDREGGGREGGMRETACSRGGGRGERPSADDGAEGNRFRLAALTPVKIVVKFVVNDQNSGQNWSN